MLPKRTLPVLIALALLAPFGTVQAGSGTHYGGQNIPAGCTKDSFIDTSGTFSPPHFTDDCYHMRTGLNFLDTPVIDVLIVTPASPYPERDMRQMRQAIEMWDEGIQHIAPQLGLGWLDQVEFRIFADDDAITTDPLWDPEIVVVATNPVGGAGIGIDPLGLNGPCRGANPLAPLDAWNALPGFRNDHGYSGTYVEDCPGGGTTCYAVNGAVDPAPGVIDFFGIFDLVAHEVGHCLSLGHVGNGEDHFADAIPLHDIMAYGNVAHDRCVSSLDVEVFALRMSEFLLPVALKANHPDGPGDVFHVQHPSDHFYASSTGEPEDCPQPDVGLVPSARDAGFTPEGGVQRVPPTLVVTSHADGDEVAAGLVTIAGTVRYGVEGVEDPVEGPFPVPGGEIAGGITIFSDLDPAAAHNELVSIGTGLAGDAKPKFLAGEPVTFRSRFTTADAGLVTVGTSTFTWTVWDAAGLVVATASCTTVADTEGFDCHGATRMPTQPGVYYASAQLDGSGSWIADTPSDDPAHPGLKAFEVLGVASPVAQTQTVEFHDGGDPANTFFTEDSTLGLTPTFGLDASERFTLVLSQPSVVVVRLEWTSVLGGDDLDLYVTGVATDESAGSMTTFELVDLGEVPAGELEIQVEPWLIADPLFGATYTLVATVVPLEALADEDEDGVPDFADACAGTPVGTPVDEEGCPIVTPPPAGENVVISVGATVLATQAVTGEGGDAWSQAVDLSAYSGPTDVVVSWYDGQWLLDRETITLDVS